MANKAYESVRIFENPILERLTHVHPLVPLLFWGPVVGLFLAYTLTVQHLAPITVVGVAAVGFVFWTLTEYLLHRFVFHYKPKGPAGERFVFIIHGSHHADPGCPTRLVMPISASILLSLIVLPAIWLIVGPIWSGSFMAGFILGYLAYDYTHYAVHHFNPRTVIGKFLKHNHMIHHFKEHEARWGVSSPFWDYVFGTVEERKAKSSDQAHSV